MLYELITDNTARFRHYSSWSVQTLLDVLRDLLGMLAKATPAPDLDAFLTLTAGVPVLMETEWVPSVLVRGRQCVPYFLRASGAGFDASRKRRIYFCVHTVSASVGLACLHASVWCVCVRARAQDVVDAVMCVLERWMLAVPPASGKGGVMEGEVQSLAVDISAILMFVSSRASVEASVPLLTLLQKLLLVRLVCVSVGRSLHARAPVHLPVVTRTITHAPRSCARGRPPPPISPHLPCTTALALDAPHSLPLPCCPSPTAPNSPSVKWRSPRWSSRGVYPRC
jgi:hypothetical protein